MALKNSAIGEIRRPYSIEELKDAVQLMRVYNLVALHAAGSGHAGGGHSHHGYRSCSLLARSRA